jgi:putative transposase
MGKASAETIQRCIEAQESMIIRRAFKFKLKPTTRQEVVFKRYTGAVCWIWNEMLAERRRVYKEAGKGVSMHDQKRRLPELKKQPETTWLKEIHAQVLQEAVINLDRAFVNFFERRAGYLKFKPREQRGQSFTYPQGVKVRDNQVYLPKIGWVRFRKSQEIEGTIKRATVSNAVSGWYVSIQVETEAHPTVQAPVTEETTVGVDLGLADFVVLSDGTRVPAPQFFRKMERTLAREERKLSRCQKGSNRRRKQRDRVARLHERVANMRRDWLHKLSTGIVNQYDTVVLEDLNVKGLVRTRLAKSVQDAAWGEFRRQVEYKAAWQGKHAYRVDRFLLSSKICNHCGTLNEIELSDRQFVCGGCGEIVDRDLNAANNIKYHGLFNIVAAGQTETLNARGQMVRPATAGAFG